MSDETGRFDNARMRTLEVEVRALQQQLEQREQLLKVLNRRLLQLERGESGISGMETGMLLSENRALKEQLGLLRNTKLFRWSSPVRDVYARLRRPQ